jgi:predicted tellurium resistance membrane protein TerC
MISSASRQRSSSALFHCVDFFVLSHSDRVSASRLEIVGAVVMRAAMILAGTALIERVDWILNLFGAFLIVSGVRMALVGHPPDLEKNPIIIWIRQLFPSCRSSPVNDLLCGEKGSWSLRRLRWH